MSSSLKIKVVIGSHRDAAMLAMWESVAAYHSVELLALESIDQPVCTTLPVTMFPLIPDMPGFMRDVDRFLVGADLVVAIDTSRLFSFQSLRAARKLGVKFCCIAHEFSPFVYEKYTNIRAIQYDIHQFADLFFTSSRKTEQLLQIEGVSADRMVRLPAVMRGSDFAFDPGKRQKFRRYVGIPDDAVLITVKTSLEDIDPTLTIMQGVRLCMNRIAPGLRSKVRLLVCGDGQSQSKLKYEASDMGLGSKVLFLAQDTSPFLSDLLAATDLLIEGRWTKKYELEPLPWHALAAACAGVQVILPRGSVADEWLTGVDVTKIDDFSSADLAFELAKLVEAAPPQDLRRFTSQSASAILSSEKSAAIFLKALDKVCHNEDKISRRQGLNTFIKQHQVPVTYRDACDVLVKCEELRDFASTCELEHYSEIMRIRGDALVALSRADEAIQSFEHSLKINHTNFQALRGLGYLAWHGHSHEDALSFFKRGLAVNPNDYQCLMGVGLVYRRLKMFEESVFWLQKAVAVGGPESPSLSILVQACLENPDNSVSLDVLTSIRESLGDHPNLLTAIDKLESHQ
jgi:tetratricopeptide (TPR) repeat protein